MTSAYLSMDWIAKIREMDLDEVIKVEDAARQVHAEKLNERLKKNGTWLKTRM